MAFDNLSLKINRTLKNIAGKGKLSERNMNEMLDDIKVALIEADVNYKVVQLFLENIKERFLGNEVSMALDPSQMVLKIVNDELVNLLGDDSNELQFNLNGISTIMMVGLQGTGKTTASAKLANLLNKKQSKKVMLIAADIIRPAAIEQLQVLGKQAGVEVFTMGTSTKASETVTKGLIYAKEKGYDTVIIDTAGRLHIDLELMDELKDLQKISKPTEVLLTADAMSGQDIVNVAKEFNDQLNISGIVATKFDGDSRGGGILSVKAVTGVPIKLVSSGEKIEDIDIFYPTRMAERILGMGDMMTLIEQAEEKLDAQANQRSLERMMNGQFTLQDMLDQFMQVRKMGPISGIMKMLPGMGEMSSQINDQKAESDMKKQIAIIQSMTAEEREDPEILRMSRKSRIANGSGTKVEDVNRLIKTYEKTKKQMDMVSRMAKSGSLPDFSNIFKK